MATRIMRILLAAVVLACLLASGSPSPATAQDRWDIFVYMCGSDLETNHKAATNNLNALKSVALPENVRFIIQTGGAKKWHTKGIPGNALGRYVYDNAGFHEIEQLEDASMGDEATLEDFLRFGKEHFSADRRVLVFWDHGGGSLGGFCFDEKYETSLHLKDLRKALDAAEGANPAAPSFDLVLFDTCLMATIETANTLQGHARYLAASEETMPATGTDYAGWAGRLAENPAMDGKALGMAICETYLPYCKANECDDMATLSLIDLGKLPALNAAYERMGRDALRESQRDPKYFFTFLDRVADGVEHYGPNDEDDWTNMIDLGSLSAGLGEWESAPAFTQAVQDAVTTHVAGPYRQHGMGLSGYYCLDGSIQSWMAYDSLPGTNPAIASLYRNMLVGDEDGKPWFDFDAEKLADAPVTFDSENFATIVIPPEDANAISDVSFILCCYDKNGQLVYLGSDDKLEADWEHGIFRESFDGQWPALNGNFLPMWLKEQQKGYNIYYSYILLNGKKCYLRSVYDMETQTFKLLGAQRILEHGWLDREILQLRPGDRIVPLFLNKKSKEIKGDAFTLEGVPILQDEPLPDSIYAFAFRFSSPRNENVVSDTVLFHVHDGTVEPYEE